MEKVLPASMGGGEKEENAVFLPTIENGFLM